MALIDVFYFSNSDNMNVTWIKSIWSLLSALSTLKWDDNTHTLIVIYFTSSDCSFGSVVFWQEVLFHNWKPYLNRQ
jgi:hypothetical protein